MLNDAERLALAFTAVLREWLRPDEWETMVERNRDEDRPDVCHSHDFCDANMAMAEGWTQIFGEGAEVNAEDEDDCILWGKAWDIAKVMWEDEDDGGHVQGGAYYLPDGTEVNIVLTSDFDEELFFPRDWDRENGPLEEGTVLVPRIETCDHGHNYHLIVENFPLCYRCPICGDGDLEKFFRAAGYELSHTGGGCSAWERIYRDEKGTTWLIMVTDDMEAPRRSDDLLEPLVGVYEIGADGEYVDEEGTFCSGPNGEYLHGSLDVLPQEVREWVKDALSVLKGGA